MRRHRIRVVGSLCRLYEEADAQATTFTIIPRHWEFTPDELMGVDPKALLRRLRADLYRAGAAKTKGWMFVYIHGEYDPNAKVYRLHVHGLCSNEMVPVLDRLRKKPNYKSVRTLPDGSWSPVYRRVWVRRKPLYDLPYPLTYLMQSFWPSRPIFINEAGQRRRVRDKRAIPEPFHSQVLLWLDQFELQDLALLIGLRVTRNGLQQTSSRR
ncbi:hypothetical protein GRI58_13475 [Porphyrobacter algicida]|uniref:Uncharacterized protein n=1 Tax=Qipengyuania algicida TaxID=1836209 RepID=A0A845AK43_9SPHN|nr:hypothetical protein [Qipengyuania algicida]MXP29819.1 hypothetical protein [Qipengyuania algicida]